MDTASIVAEIKQFDVLNEVPEADLNWLVEHSEIKEFHPEELIFKAGDPVDYLIIVLEGSAQLVLEQNGRSKSLGKINKGDITGLLPYSRLKVGIGYAKVIDKVTALYTHRDQFSDMICHHHDLVQPLVSFMTTRVRNFTTLQQQNEKLVALGKLSAGLSHELNNPASAIVRSSEILKAHLSTVPDKFKKVLSIKMTDEQIDAVNDILHNKIACAGKCNLSLMQRTELEDEITDWLDDHELGDLFEVAENFAEFQIHPQDLDDISKLVSDTDLAPVLQWLDNVMTTERMVAEIADASQRISALVKSVKTYSHMDRADDKELADIREGLRSTLTMLNHKVRKNKINVIENMPAELPKVSMYVSEINQVWTNLIDNALDAMEENGGTLEIKAFQQSGFLKVQIIDSGKGIPEDTLPQIFDPFFTTKDVGKGTGLGLDVVQKIVTQHNALIDVESEPGKTCFTVSFVLK